MVDGNIISFIFVCLWFSVVIKICKITQINIWATECCDENLYWFPLFSLELSIWTQIMEHGQVNYAKLKRFDMIHANKSGLNISNPEEKNPNNISKFIFLDHSKKTTIPVYLHVRVHQCKQNWCSRSSGREKKIAHSQKWDAFFPLDRNNGAK